MGALTKSKNKVRSAPNLDLDSSGSAGGTSALPMARPCPALGTSGVSTSAGGAAVGGAAAAAGAVDGVAAGTVAAVNASGPAATAAAASAPGAADVDLPPEEDSDDEEEPGWVAFLPIIMAMAYELIFEAIDSGGVQVTIMFLLPVFLFVKKLVLQLWAQILYGGHAPPPPPGVLAPPAAPPPPPPPDVVGMTMKMLFEFAEARPILYFTYNFGIAAIIGTFFLFLQDIQNYFARRRAKAKMDAQMKSRRGGGYEQLEEGGGGDGAEDADEQPVDLDELKRELVRVTDRAEELEIKTRVNRKATSEAAMELRTHLKSLQERREELRALLQEPAQIKKPKEEKNKEPGFFAKIMKSTFVQIMTKAANGIMTVILYFADLMSDLGVVQLLLDSGNMLWAYMSILILIAQFVAVYARVLPYLSATFGADSTLFRLFLVFGFPWGCLMLDGLMFLEPFGLLTVLPFPDWLRQFVPAYKATRIIAEVAIESLPQCLLQAYIYIVVVTNVRKGTASESQLAMVEFASLLPKSILISTLATLKTWIELVSEARQAGLSVVDKAVQLWNVGAGLPLDALQKGAIDRWVCPYRLQPVEISPLLDALGKNSSLIHLDLAQSGITWSGSHATGAALIATVADSPAALSGLQSFVISSDSLFKMPIMDLRSMPDVALAALRRTPFFEPKGPRREEIYFIADILRTNTNVAIVEKVEKQAGETVAKLRASAKQGKLKKEAWMEQVTQLMIDGATRRGHLQSLVSAECLRDVGFKASELLPSGFLLNELRAGNFTAAEMRATGIKAADMKAAGYTARELKSGGYSAATLKAALFTARELKIGGFSAKQLKAVNFTALELKDNGFSAGELKDGTFTAAELKPLFTVEEMREARFKAAAMKTVEYTLRALKDGGYTATELKEASYGGSDMKKAGFVAQELKVAGYSPAEMRIAGFIAQEMAAAGFTAKKLKLANYAARETRDAGFSVEVLKNAGYTAQELRSADVTAAELKAVDFALSELKSAGYTTTELQDVGFGAEELRAAGTSLAELTSAGASVAELKAAGISAMGLKAEGVSLLDMKNSGYSVKELKAAAFTAFELHEVQYPAYELTAVGFTANEVRACLGNHCFPTA